MDGLLSIVELGRNVAVASGSPLLEKFAERLGAIRDGAASPLCVEILNRAQAKACGMSGEKKMAEPLRAPPSLLEHEPCGQIDRTATASERPSVGTSAARVAKACAPVSRPYGRRELSLATNLAYQYTQSCDRTNV